MIATACTIETIIEDPLLPILKEDSNVTKPAGQIRRPGLDHNPTSPRFELFMIDFIPYPKIGVSFNVRLYFRKTLRLSLRKKFSQLFSSCREYIPFTPFPQAEFNQSPPGASFVFPLSLPSPMDPNPLIRILKDHRFKHTGKALHIDLYIFIHISCKDQFNRIFDQ